MRTCPRCGTRFIGLCPKCYDIEAKPAAELLEASVAELVEAPVAELVEAPVAELVEARTYDAIVVGCGAVGSATALQLARRGASVLALDRFAPGHDRGSSHGETRIIRLAYAEHPDYVPHLRRAYELWAELEREHGAQLYYETGLLEVGPRDGAFLRSIRASAREHGLALEELAREEVERRFPLFALDPGHAAVFEQRAGYLLVEACVRALAAAAARAGAELRTGVAVTGWTAHEHGVEVTLEAGGTTEALTARRLVITAGAWASELLADLGLPLHVLRKPVFWLGPSGPRSGASLTFIYDTDWGSFYGFPSLDGESMKVAEHSGGERVADPLTVDRSMRHDDLARVEAFRARHLPSVDGEVRRHDVCMYTMTPDEHFIVDRHPRHANVVFAAGLSGHGFKFAPVLGEVLADLALEGHTELPAAFLGLGREGLTAGAAVRSGWREG